MKLDDNDMMTLRGLYLGGFSGEAQDARPDIVWKIWKAAGQSRDLTYFREACKRNHAVRSTDQ